MGSCPEWYTIMRAAKYLGVAPWELMKQPRVWMDWALLAEGAEYEASRSEKRISPSH